MPVEGCHADAGVTGAVIRMTGGQTERPNSKPKQPKLGHSVTTTKRLDDRVSWQWRPETVTESVKDKKTRTVSTNKTVNNETRFLVVFVIARSLCGFCVF